MVLLSGVYFTHIFQVNWLKLLKLDENDDENDDDEIKNDNDNDNDDEKDNDDIGETTT